MIFQEILHVISKKCNGFYSLLYLMDVEFATNLYQLD